MKNIIEEVELNASAIYKNLLAEFARENQTVIFFKHPATRSFCFQIGFGVRGSRQRSQIVWITPLKLCNRETVQYATKLISDYWSDLLSIPPE